METVVLVDGSILYGAFRLILQLMYDNDLASEESLKQWISLRRNDEPDSQTGRLFLEPQVQMFVEWLEEDDEDEDSESGEDEDE